MTWCEETIITIGGLRGATVPPGVEPDANGDTFLPIWDGLFAAGTVPSERYGWGGVVGRGLWDDVSVFLFLSGVGEVVEKRWRIWEELWGAERECVCVC